MPILDVLLTSVPGIITGFFLLIVLSYYLLLFFPHQKRKAEKSFKDITVIIPAHNEELYVRDCITSVQKASFTGGKNIIVVDDGSKDATYDIATSFSDKTITVIQTKHSGKSASLNQALANVTTDLVAVVDADSEIAEDALETVKRELEQENVVAATCIVKVKNRTKPYPMWAHIEQLYNSLIRAMFAKVNANVTTPGPLSVYRTKELKAIGGFSTEGFSEDVDVTIRLIRKGHHVAFSDKAFSYTNMPDDGIGFWRQRTRFARGLVNVLKRHLQVSRHVIDWYTLPLLFFSYVQALVMGSLTLYQLASGYVTYFASKGIYLSSSVLLFFFEWFSIVGFIKWTLRVFQGLEPLTFIAIVGIISTLLTYPLYLAAIIRFDRKIDLLHIIPLFFMFPFWLLIMIIYIICVPEYFRKKQYNIWKKNE